MSVQFGRWNFDRKPVEQEYLEKIQPLLVPYGPDDLGSYSKGNVSMLYCAFHTTRESRRESQPYVSPSGAVITWDGRLDNRSKLISDLLETTTAHSTDVEIIAAAYERWGSSCFARLIGDWAVAIWHPIARSLTLAKDPIGVRHLYYSFDNNQVIWSTVVDPLVLFAGKAFALCEEYIAGWFSYFPAAHLTPYVGIKSVPPSSCVLIRDGQARVEKYWDFDPHKRILYRSDAEYEEHFRTVFGEAVRRRLRSQNPVLAELSGGMDSSSIVCLADRLMADGKADTPRLDTLSCYDDSEPNWNERPYFTKVEEKRGRTGTHIDVSRRVMFNFGNDRFAAIPGSEYWPTDEVRRLAACLIAQGNRVVLSGIGGDEVMGGVPTPILEFEDLLANGQFRILAHKLKIWALHKRVPWLHLLLATVNRFLPSPTFNLRKEGEPGAWLDSGFVKRNRAAMQPFRRRVSLFGSLPSFQGNLATLQSLQKQLACDILQSEPLCEKTYPFLDRSLLEFMYAIPREQLVRPGRRRSLMRRALKDVVPADILERSRKAYVSRSPIGALQMARVQIKELLADSSAVEHEYVDVVHLARAMDSILNGEETKEWSLLMKTVIFELWLRGQQRYLFVTEGIEEKIPTLVTVR
jgi:asparagine synthase (glutamine-hydrolysing)